MMHTVGDHEETVTFPEKGRYSRASKLLSLVAITLTLTVHTATITSLYVYVGSYVKDIMGLSSMRESGYYAGWITSSYMLGRLLTAYAWGIFADRFGRKPVFIVTLVSMALCPIAFGMSTSLGAAIACWFIMGTTTGVWSIARIVIPELLGPEHVVMGMGCLPGGRAIGIIIGPLCGGLLAQPSEAYPDVFPSSGVFGRYPFLLPNLVLAAFAISSLPLVILFLPETLVRKEDAEHECASTGYPSSGSMDRIAGVEFTPTDEDHGVAAPPSPATDASALKAVEGPEGSRGQLRSRRYNPVPPFLGPPAGMASEGSSGWLRRSARCDDAAGGTFDEEVHSCEDEDEDDSCALLRRPRVSEHCKRRDSEGWCTLAPCRCSSARLTKMTGDDPGAGSSETGGRLRLSYEQTLLLMEGLYAVMNIGFHEIYPLWALAPLDSGGLDWNLEKVGNVMGWTGVGILAFQLTGYPLLCHTLGIVSLLRVTGVIGSILRSMVPYIQRTAWSRRHSYLASVSLLLLVDICGSVWNIAIPLAAANAVPTYKRGKFSGVLAMAETLGRTVGPPLFGSLLAWSMHPTTSERPPGGGILDYHLVFVVSSVLMATVVAIGWRMLTLERLTIPLEERGTSPRGAGDYQSGGAFDPVPQGAAAYGCVERSPVVS